jgi:hypothetical protein
LPSSSPSSGADALEISRLGRRDDTCSCLGGRWARLGPRLPQPHQLHRQIASGDRRVQTPTTPSIMKSRISGQAGAEETIGSQHLPHAHPDHREKPARATPEALRNVIKRVLLQTRGDNARCGRIRGP